MKVSLFIPCFVDQYFPDAGMACVKILKKLGHEVLFPERQTCCGQPPFNTGFWKEAREAAKRALDVFESAEIVVGPSGSCIAMMKDGYGDLFKGTADEARARALAAKTFEFTQFLVNVLGVTDLGASFPHKVTFHDGCHGLRMLGAKREPRALLEKVRGLELVEMGEAESCCGFGGTFSVKFPKISTAMVEKKAASIVETGAEYVTSLDASCLMNIGGYASRNRLPFKTIHVAEILANF